MDLNNILKPISETIACLVFNSTLCHNFTRISKIRFSTGMKSYETNTRASDKLWRVVFVEHIAFTTLSVCLVTRYLSLELKDLRTSLNNLQESGVDVNTPATTEDSSIPAPSRRHFQVLELDIAYKQTCLIACK